MSAATLTFARKRRGVLTGHLASWTCAFILIAFWQLLATLGHSLYFPPPSEIFLNMYDLWFSAGLHDGIVTAAFRQDIVPSVDRLVVSLVFAWVIGIAAGIFLGRLHHVAPFVEPILHFMRALPGPVLLPLALVLVGTGDDMRVGLIVFGAVWPVLFNTYSAVLQVPESYLENALVAHRSRTSVLFQVLLPSSSSAVLAGMRVSAGLGVILLVASELVAASNGIGFGLTQSQRLFNFMGMWSFIAALSILGYLLNLLLSLFERIFLGWHKQLKALED